MDTFYFRIVLIIFIACIPLVVRRRKEIDANGNPSIRFYGFSLTSLLAGVLFLYFAIMDSDLATYKAHPESLYVYLILICIPLMLSIWLFILKVTLTGNGVELLVWPFSARHYPLGKISSITKGRYNFINFSDGSRMLIFPSASGCDYFFQELEAKISTSPTQSSR